MTELVSLVNESLEEFYVDNSEQLKWYSVPVREFYFRTLSAIEKELLSGNLELEDFGRVLDFGCGIGVSSIVLNQVSDEVIALDINPNGLEYLSDTGLFPESQIVCQNGLSYMDENIASFDLITAFGFGFGGIRNSFIQRFYDAAKKAVLPNGKILIESYKSTMDIVSDALNVSYSNVEPYTLVL